MNSNAKTLKPYDTPYIERKVINGKRLTIKQTQQFDYFMENSETFRNRFFELSTLVASE